MYMYLLTVTGQDRFARWMDSTWPQKALVNDVEQFPDRRALISDVKVHLGTLFSRLVSSFLQKITEHS